MSYFKSTKIIDSNGNVAAITADGYLKVIRQGLTVIPDVVSVVNFSDTTSSTPTVYNVTLTNADTEYSQALPAGTKAFRFRCRTLYDVRYAYVTGKVATPTAPYLTLPAGSDFRGDGLTLSAQTLFLATDQAGVIVEIEAWV